jgi:hypothetical protein
MWPPVSALQYKTTMRRAAFRMSVLRAANVKDEWNSPKAMNITFYKKQVIRLMWHRISPCNTGFHNFHTSTHLFYSKNSNSQLGLHLHSLFQSNKLIKMSLTRQDNAGDEAAVLYRRLSDHPIRYSICSRNLPSLLRLTSSLAPTTA